MTDILKNLSVAQRIALIAIIPMLAAAALAYGSLARTWEAVAKSDAVVGQVATAQQISSLVHELQKERGMSAGFIGSKGVKFGDRLEEQRSASDEAFTRLDTTAEGNAELASAIAHFEQVSRMRGRVDAQETSVAEVAKFYTGGINALLAAMDTGGRNTGDYAVMEASQAYTAIALAKEKAGLERAMGATGFGAGRFAPEIYDRFIGLQARQDVYLEQFTARADGANRQLLARTLETTQAQEVLAMRNLARSGQPPAAAINPERWWDSITVKIDGLREVENSVGDRLAAIAEANRASANSAMLQNALILLIIGALTLAATITVVLGITRPLHALRTATDRMAKGNLDTDIGVEETRDEIGRLAASIRVFRDRLTEAETEQAAHAHEREENLRRIEERSRKVETLTGHFDSEMNGAMEVFAHSVDSLMATAEELDRQAHDASERSTLVASASQQTNVNVQIVASATEELSLSIEEIFTQVSRSAQSIADAADEADIANADMKALDNAARQIDEAVKLIADVTEQTNVLALNATIEAARAGKEGAGFAVVATEVRSLAEQTAVATRQISGVVAEVVAKTDRAVRGMERIADTIRVVEQAGTAMSAALEQQGAAAKNIAQSVHEAAVGVEQVDSNIAEIERTSANARDRVQSVIDAATNFNDRAGSVRGSVDTFLASIKAA